MRQHAPLRPGLAQIEDGIDDVAFVMAGLRPALILGPKMVFDECPCFVGEVAGVHVLDNSRYYDLVII